MKCGRLQVSELSESYLFGEVETSELYPGRALQAVDAPVQIHVQASNPFQTTVLLHHRTQFHFSCKNQSSEYRRRPRRIYCPQAPSKPSTATAQLRHQCLCIEVPPGSVKSHYHPLRPNRLFPLPLLRLFLHTLLTTIRQLPLKPLNSVRNSVPKAPERYHDLVYLRVSGRHWTLAK